MESPDYRNQRHEISNKHFSNNSQCLSIDGPGSKLTSALQVVTEALSSTENVSNQSSSIQINQAPLSNVLSLANNLTTSQTTPSLHLNTIGLTSNTYRDDQNSQVQECPKTMLINQATNLSQSTSFERSSLDAAQSASNSTSSSNFSSLDSIRTNNGSDMVPAVYDTHQGPIASATGKTVVSPDSDVSNGFVKDG